MLENKKKHTKRLHNNVAHMEEHELAGEHHIAQIGFALDSF